ncbi:MAG: SpoIIE family protein phosphatase [Verrucomicrobiales bacterium]
MARPDPNEALIDVARGLSSAKDVEELLDQILSKAKDVMFCEACSILLPERPGGDLIIRSTLSAEEGGEPLRVPPGKGIAGEVFETGEMLNIADVQGDPRHYPPPGRRIDLEARAMLTIPLVDGGRCIGVLQAINPRGGPSFVDEDIHTFQTFGSLIAVTLMRIQAQRAAVRDAELRREQSFAREIQLSYLPSPADMPPALQFSPYYRSAGEVGGDFYFWHPAGDRRVIAGIGDVCGKGLPAALDMVRASTLIAARAQNLAAATLGEWVTDLNRELCRLMAPGRFTAATFLLADLQAATISVLAAGQTPPLAFRGGAWESVGCRAHPPLAISEAVAYRASHFPLAMARSWLLYSDGLPELRGADGSYFGDAEFPRLLAASGERHIIESLSAAWRGFGAEGAEYEDDCTLLLMRDARLRPQPVYEAMLTPEATRDVRAIAAQWCEICGLRGKAADLVVLGCDEALSNIFRHAYCREPGPLRALFSVGESDLEIAFHHEGDPHRPCPGEAIPAPCPERAGGMGQHVMREAFDSIDYESESDGAGGRVLLRKRLLDE